MKRLCCLCLVLVQWIGMMNLQDVFAWETIGDAATLLLGKENVLTNLYTPDQGVLVERGGRYGRQLKIDGSNSKYFWIDINDDFAYDIPEYSPMKLTVEYFDEGQGGFEIDYDTHKPYWKHNMWPQFPGGEMNEIWGTVGCVQMENTKQWQTKTYYIEDMRLANRIEGGRDLRIGLWGPILGGHSAEDVVFGSITLEKVDWEKPVQVNPCSSEKIGNIFHPDEPIALYLNYQNKGSQKLNTKIEISVSDSNHTVFWTETKAQVFEAREVKSISVVPQDIPDRYDIFVGDVTITSYFENKPEHVYVQKHQFEFSKSMRVEKKNPRMGTNQQINALRRGTIDDIPHLMSDLGITGNRDGIYWRDIEKEKNVLIMPEGDEARIRGQVENGSEVLMFFTDGIPLWNGGNRHAAPNTDEGIAAFGRYCGFVAQKLGDVIDYYEIWNEWNIDVFNISMEPPEVYVKLLKAAYTEIKKADPDSVVIGIDTAEIPLDMIRQMMDLGAYDYMDAYSTHPYDWSGTFQIDRFVENVTALKELMREYGPEKPHYITEMGFSNFLSQDPNVRGGFTREEQAYNSVKMHLWNYAYDLSDCLYQYSFLDQLDPYNREHNWGLTRGYAHAETPFGAKPSYLAIAAYNAFAGAYEYIDQTEVDGEYHSFRFYNENLDKDVLIFCSEDEEKQITYELGTNEVELYDLYGNKMCDLYSENGKYTFSVKPLPFYVVGDIPTCIAKESEIDAVVEVDINEKTVTANDITTFTFTKHTAKELQIEVEENGSISVYENNGFVDNIAKLKIATAPDASQECTFNVHIKDKDGKVFFSERFKLTTVDPIGCEIYPEQAVKGTDHWRIRIRLHNRSETKDWSGTVAVTQPLHFAETLSPKKFIRLGAGKSIDLLMKLPHQAIQRVVDLCVVVTLENGKSFEFNKPMDFGIVSYMEKPPVLDGEIGNGEWKGNWIGADEKKDICLIEGWDGPKDLSFSGSLAWDNENFYMLGVVTDDVYALDTSSTGGGDPHYMYKGDSIQFALDDREFVNIVEEGTFTEIGLGEVVGQGYYVWRYKSLYHQLLPQKVEITDAELFVKHHTGYTVYEVKIPWASIFKEDFVPVDGKKLRFSLLVNDNDGEGRRGWIEYRSGIGDGKDIKKFGSVTLVK